MLQKIHDSFGRWIVVVILGLIAFTFIFWGINRSDFSMAGGQFAAKVNGENIPMLEFDRALQQRQNQYQQIYRSELPEDVRRDLRRAVIDQLVQQTALRQRVADQGYRASAERIDSAIQNIAAFQIDGVFNEQQAVGLLANQGLTPAGFRALQREELEVGDLTDGIAMSSFLTPAEFRRYIELYNQQREVAYALFGIDAFSANVAIDDAAIASRYENNKTSYQTAETIDLEYIELAMADIAATVQVTEEQLRATYETERDRFETPEQRHAEHILVETPEGQEEAARGKADAIVARLRGGEDFAAVAAAESADAGTKAQGGDLGWISRGGFLVGPFEDALYALQVGAVSEPVRTEAGYHIIRLAEVRAGAVQPFEAVREEIAAELRTREAENEFYDRANKLGEEAFDAYDNLQPVADASGLPIKTAMGFPRTGDPAVFENSAAVVQAAFAEEIVDSGRNSEIVELAEDHVLVLRVKDHHVPTTKPLEEVRDQVHEELVRERAQQLAEEAAAAFLTDIEQGGDPAARAAAHGGMWNAPAWVTRTDANVPTEILSSAFGLPKADAAAPQRESVALASGGQAVIILSGVKAGEPESMTNDEREQRRQQLANQAARAELTGYVGNLRAEAKVRIPDEVLNPPVF
ncbi:MAG TPA: SurA N-terminal domain-containing protein [Gammaproteobacteria bacterium]|nr:SurA N-terminal domain-containing protein [Gammaproteobacteria bacterium]